MKTRNSKWKLLVKRETVLLERYLRVEGYSQMIPSLSKVKVKNLFVVNHEGLTAQYVDEKESNKRLAKFFSEYKSAGLDFLIRTWQIIVSAVEATRKRVLETHSKKDFDTFAKNYKLCRGIVLYVEALGKALQQKGTQKDLDRVQHWHELSETVSSKAWDRLRPFFQSVSKKNNVSLNEIYYYLPSEFVHLLTTGKTVPSRTLVRRREYYVLWLNQGKITLYLEQSARKIEQEQLPTGRDDSKISQVKGSVAYRGVVRGRVRIVNTLEQMIKMRKGEILVSTMTTPRLIHAVRKAAAIVTDEGGVICHAAVVSREFKIPCVVGTKIATKVFKDGDMVEVDANKGIVRKLDSKSVRT